MSLRARLLVMLVALAAAGLAIAGIVTYTEQRSFLFARVDEQAASAVPLLSRALDDRDGIADRGPFGGGPPPGGR